MIWDSFDLRLHDTISEAELLHRILWNLSEKFRYLLMSDCSDNMLVTMNNNSFIIISASLMEDEENGDGLTKAAVVLSEQPLRVVAMTDDSRISEQTQNHDKHDSIDYLD